MQVKPWDGKPISIRAHDALPIMQSSMIRPTSAPSMRRRSTSASASAVTEHQFADSTTSVRPAKSDARTR